MDAGSVITMVFDVGLAVVVLGVIIGGILLSRRQQSHAAAGQGPYAGAAQALSRAPTTRLGYVSSATETGGRGYGGQAARTKMVRTVGTCPLSWTSEAPSTGHSVRMAFSWDSTLATPARVPLHVAPARLVGLTGSATDAVTNRTRSFRPRYSVAIRDLPPHGARATDVVECSRTACTDSQSEWSGANASAYARPRERKSLAMVRPVGQKNRCNEAGSSRRPTLSGPDDDTASDARVQTMAPVFLALRNREDGRMTRGDRKIRSAAGMFAVGAGSPRRSWWGWPWACKGSGSSRPSPTVYLAECASGWASGGGPYAQKRSSGRHAMRTMTRTLVSTAGTAVLLLALTACGSQSATSTAPSSPAETNEMGHFATAAREVAKAYGRGSLVELVTTDAGMTSLANADCVHYKLHRATSSG